MPAFRSGAWERRSFSAGITFTWSALGPGGLRARIAHHQKQSTRPHWHIDFLRAHTRLHLVWLRYDMTRREHEWARAMQKVEGATIPFPGFGASDCGCPSHLYSKRCHTQISFRAGCRFEASADELLAKGSILLPMQDFGQRPVAFRWSFCWVRKGTAPRPVQALPKNLTY